jgi:hypothetical protein
LVITVSVFFTTCSKDKKTDTNEIKGFVFAPNGKTPIAGATVYIKKKTKSTNILKSQNNNLESCAPPPEAYIATTCTNADGSFSFTLPDGNTDDYSISVVKGVFWNEYSILGSSTFNLVFEADSVRGKLALVTGAFDNIQDILASIGLGKTDENSLLIEGTELFDIYDGTGNDIKYPDFLTIFDIDNATNKPKLFQYQILFINCGVDQEWDIFIGDPAKKDMLREYVNQGGRLFVTDQAYDFVEQAFPEYLDFYGSDNTNYTVAEEWNQAEVGKGDIEVTGVVKDFYLAWWLHGLAFSSINDKDEIQISGFATSWAVLNGVHPANSSKVKIIVTGNVTYYDTDLQNFTTAVKPLTVTFVHGKGKVIYSSYHTIHEKQDIFSESPPQESILKFLCFE